MKRVFPIKKNTRLQTNIPNTLKRIFSKEPPSMEALIPRTAHPCGTNNETISMVGGGLGNPSVKIRDIPIIPNKVMPPPIIAPAWRLVLIKDTKKMPKVEAEATIPKIIKTTPNNSPQ